MLHCFLCLVLFFPVSFCFAAFFTRLEGADPSSYEAYPRVIEPAPRPSEGPGSAIVRGRLDTAFRDIFFALICLAEGHRDPGAIFGGEGALSLPPQVPFHTHSCLLPAPGFFFLFLFFGPLGPRIRAGVPDAIRATRRIIQCNSLAHQRSKARHPPPPSSSQFFVREGGNAVRFFFLRFFRRMPFFCQSSILLRFCTNNFRGANFWFEALLSMIYVLVLFFLRFAILFGFHLPKAARKNSLYPRGAMYEQFSGANFWFDAFF